MKKIFIFNLLFISTFAQAQFFDKHAIYGGTGIVYGNYGGLDGNYNYIYQEKYSVQIDALLLFRRPTFLPSDFAGFSLGEPWDAFELYGLLVGRVKKLDKKGHIRVHLRGGLGYTEVQTVIDWQREPTTSDYIYSYDRRKGIGIIFKPEIEFLLNRYLGFTLNSFLVISSSQKFAYGIQLGSMLGILRKK